MLPGNVFQLEIASAVANRRALTMRLAMPLLLALPFVFVAMPPRAKAAGLVMLLLFLAFFGAAVGMTRRRMEGHWERLRLLPLPRGLVLADLVLAGAAVDLLQAIGVFGLYILVNAPAPTGGGLVRIAALLCATALLLNALGMLLATVVRSNAEVHLVGALAVGLVALASGLFPLPRRVDFIVQTVAAFNPIAYLARDLSEIVQGQQTPALAGTVAAAGVLAALAAALVLRGLPASRPKRDRIREHSP